MPAQPSSPEPAPVTDAERQEALWQDLERKVDILLADHARDQARITVLEAGIAETIAACERQDFRIFEQLTVAEVLKPLLAQEVPDAK